MQTNNVLADYGRDVASVSERYANIAAYHIKRGESAEALRALEVVASINNRLAVYCTLQR